jgi:hypothetical protein
MRLSILYGAGGNRFIELGGEKHRAAKVAKKAKMARSRHSYNLRVVVWHK